MKTLQEQHEKALDEQKRNAEKTDFSGKKLPEVLGGLANRDDIVQSKAVLELLKRLKDENLRGHILGEVGPNTLRHLVSVLKSNSKDVVTSVIAILTILTSRESNKDTLRQIGALGDIVKTMNNPAYLIAGIGLLVNLVTEEKNREIFFKLNLFSVIFPLSQSSDSFVSLIFIKTCASLVLSEDFQKEFISSERFIGYITAAIQSTDQRVQPEAFFIVKKLASIEKFQATFPSPIFTFLLKNVDSKRCYPDEGRVKADPYELECIQLESLSILEVLTSSETPRKKFAVQDAYKLFDYLKTPTVYQPYDVFEWNMPVMSKVLLVLSNLVLDEKHRNSFLNENGIQMIVQILNYPNIFTKEVQYGASKVILNLSSTAELIHEIGRLGIPVLIRMLKIFPDLQFTIIKALKQLSADDTNKEKIFEEGGVQILANIIMNNPENEQLLVLILETFSILARSKLMRRVIRLIPNLIQTLVNFLSSGNESVVSPLALTLVLLASEPEGANAIITQGSTSALIELLDSKYESALIHAIKLVSNIIQIENGKHSLVSKGIADILVKKLLHSRVIAVQSETLKILNKLVHDGGTAQKAVMTSGLVEEIKKLPKHPNMTAPNSPIAGQMRALILTMKDSSQTEKQASKNEIWIEFNFKGFIKALKVPRTIDFYQVQIEAYKLLDAKPPLYFHYWEKNRAIEINSQTQFFYVLDTNRNQTQVELTVSEPNESINTSKIDSILSQLSVDQLKLLVKKLAPTSTIPLKQAIREILLAEKELLDLEKKKEKENAATGEVEELSTSLFTSTPNLSENRKYVSESSDDSKTFLVEMMDKVHGGGFGLKHVTSPVGSRRNVKSEKDFFGKLMDEFQDSNKNRQRKMLDSSVVEGRHYYLRDLQRWKEELQKLLLIDARVLFLIFHLLESQESELTMEDAFTYLSTKCDEEALAKAFLAIGFNVRTHTVKLTPEAPPTTVYQAILQTEETPVKLILVYLLHSVLELK